MRHISLSRRPLPRHMSTPTGAVALAIALTVASVGHANAAEALAGAVLQQTVAGKTIHLSTPFGALPISYRSDGSISGVAGKLAQYTGSPTDSGTWWISGDKLCQKWNTWLNAKSYCFSLRQDGRNVEWTRNDGVSGSATITR